MLVDAVTPLGRPEILFRLFFCQLVVHCASYHACHCPFEATKVLIIQKDFWRCPVESDKWVELVKGVADLLGSGFHQISEQ